MACTATGIEIPEDLPRERWELALRGLGPIQRGSRWWIGDLLVYGSGKQYGKTYEAALELTGYQLQTLKNFAWVSRKCPKELRRAELSWRSHKIVAALKRDEQIEWLARAAEEVWSSDELARELRRKSEADDGGKSFPSPERVCHCPECGHEGPAADFKKARS